ncbi:hypothetical protein TTHERM_00245350 (macronuclear) [Tetrahymena thermophila SB210]|uniref:G patch domain-containing protein n=1 Tax=Tetrahymena thermophila (strain SB210) TaxID=312017 RepID=Q245W4_TETTS|nr:hypothetical protein TTHERM_00245350 [Tetrahymena thermophila SB210]EAS03519.3 hypothetical protein TTHERM_00245350 [Tetrahymena thermophila SB210]|eukprot:XP_001023764.3 hypothetical protein TTHERM_00245350 [Tetrahymena thermophila SB210]
MDKILIGTRFEEEEIKQKQNFYNQKAVNEKGHKRFHGAFTGGFSAGYKGTVGSEQGFVPKTFFSSRQNRANNNNNAQSIQDYMDEEDLGTHVIGANLTTKQDYDTFSNQFEKMQTKQFGENFFGEVPSELLVEQRKTIGWEILNNIQFRRKKKEAIIKQIQEQKIQQSDQDYQEDEEINIDDFDKNDEDFTQNNSKQTFDNMENYKIKTNFHGFGFKDSKEKSDIDEFAEEDFNRIMKRSYLTQEEIEEEQEKKKQSNRIYTDFKSDYNYDDDDEDDVFANQSKKAIEYENQEVIKSQGDSQKMLKHSYMKMKGLNLLFIKDSQPLQIQLKQNKIIVPESYNPYKKMQEYIKSGGKMIEFQKQKKKIQKLNAEQRQAILEGQQEMDKIKEQIETKKFVKAKEEDEQDTKESQHQTYKSWDALKQQRYQSWVQEKEGKGIFIQVAQLMSYKDMKAEQKEFQKLYNEIQEKNPNQKKTVMDKIDDLQKKLDEIKNFRTTKPFFPDKLLCKRFGVVPPYKDKEYFDKKMEEFKQLQDRENILQTKAFVQESKSIQSFGLPTEFKSNKYGLISYKDENDMDLDEDFEQDTRGKNNKKENKFEENNFMYDVSKSYLDKKQQRDSEIQENKKIIEEMELDQKEIIKEKPPIQLFQSIFGDENDDEEEDGEQEQEKDAK